MNTLRLLFSSKGRIDRKEYLIRVVLSFIIIVLIQVFSIVNNGEFFKGLAIVSFYIILVIYLYSSTIKRLHDVDLSGWYSLLLIVPFINIVFILYLIIRKGNGLVNKFGKPFC